MQIKEAILKEYFGYDEFRVGQADIIDSLLNRRDVLCVMPTGGGKSMCFQIPSIMLPGVTIVVSPLISLMKDQVAALVRSGVKAAYINSSLTSRQLKLVHQRAATGAYKIIYTAPERLNTPEFLSLCRYLDISMVTVDEAHCVSHWGQDFRPSYLEISAFVDSLPVRPVVGAFTATATDTVRNDIVKMLQLRDPYTRVTGFDRSNLYFEVRKPTDRNVDLLEFVSQRPDRYGIVYCSTRDNVRFVGNYLKDNGIKAEFYHAGLDDTFRRKAQDDFTFDRVNVLVATNAFGMGIDKSNVSFVVHYNMPGSMEAYYQEAGRAGRDGSPSECLMFYNGQDYRTHKFFIENDSGSNLPPDLQAEKRRLDYKRLQIMMDYVKTDKCLREYILHYFGEIASDKCGNCAPCLGVKSQPSQPSQPKVSRRQAAAVCSDPALFETLRAVRKKLAETDSIPAFVVFSDVSLRDMVEKRPQNEAEFLEIHGVGQEKLKRYGQAFLEQLKN
ncbi:hypothetical protein FACS1894105_04430 [Clostridia bacterium]|nr:hypothetical protein FACS1894105_04430 [Clostridia bacterium]